MIRRPVVDALDPRGGGALADPTSEPVRRERRRPRWQVWAAIGAGIALAAAVGAIVATAVDVGGSSSTTATGSSCSITSIADQGLPSVVMISVQARDGTRAASGTGSGEVIRSSGEILTNNHVISAAANGGSISVLFNDGTTADAHLVGRDPQTDLAVIKLDEVREHLTVIEFGVSSELRVGETVVALGAPLGFPDTVTSGIVSALDRSVQVPIDGGTSALLTAAIQTDTAINPGNSGGALMDCDAHLVGVPTAGAVVPGSTAGGSIGIGFAIPADFAKVISDEIIATGRVTHASFGVQVVPVQPTAANPGRNPGLFVVGVDASGPSAAAGIRGGDVITELGGKPATSAQQLQALTLTRKPGDTVHVTYERGGRPTTVAVTLTAPPGS